MTYSIHHFIKKFRSIPEHRWCTVTFKRENERFCALGHCGASIIKGVINETEESKALNEIFNQLSPIELTDRDATILGMKYITSNPFRIVTYINDGKAKKYQQETPKKRILAGLDDVLKMENEFWKREVKKIFA